MKKSILIACVSLMASFIHPMWLLVFLGATIAFLCDLYAESKYKKETYYKDTGISYWSMRKDSGRYGEYLIYNNLKHREGQDGKFLFNLYLPTDSGKTTEIAQQNFAVLFSSSTFSKFLISNSLFLSSVASSPENLAE